jgi:hypothetical protein
MSQPQAQTNAQAALAAAATVYTATHSPSALVYLDTVTTYAEQFLAWLDQQDDRPSLSKWEQS